jgi:exodeoxyribonuclease VII small subunit
MPKHEPKPEAPSFETALGDLENVVQQLEGAELPLEKSLELFEKGMQLSDTCRRQLAEAETKVEILLKKGEKVQAEPFTPDKA